MSSWSFRLIRVLLAAVTAFRFLDHDVIVRRSEIKWVHGIICANVPLPIIMIQHFQHVYQHGWSNVERTSPLIFGRCLEVMVLQGNNYPRVGIPILIMSWLAFNIYLAGSFPYRWMPAARQSMKRWSKCTDQIVQRTNALTG